MKKIKEDEKPYLFKKLKTYTVDEIIAAGGTTEFANKTNYDGEKFYHLDGDHLTQEEFEQALKALSK